MGAARYLSISRISFRSRTAYIMDVLAGSFFYALILFVFVQLWTTLAGSGHFAIEGLGARELVWYMVVTEGIMLGRARIEQETDEEVKTGSIAYLIGRPCHYVLFKFAVYWGDTLLRLIINVAVGSLVALIAVGPPRFDQAHLLQVVVSAVLAFSLNFFMVMCISLAAFWVEDTMPFRWIYSKLLFILGGLFAPMEVYPAAVARLARALPFSYMLYAPARLFVQYDTALFWRIVVAQVGWIIITLRHNSSMSLTSCEVRKTVTPSSRFMVRISSRILLLATTSRPIVGSSRKSTLGPCKSEAAISHLMRCPKESFLTGVDIISSSSNISASIDIRARQVFRGMS
jgi:ABC-2 type transport system permease protein